MKNSWKRPVPFQLGLLLAAAVITVVTTQDSLRDTGPDERRRERLTRPGRGVEAEGPAGGGQPPHRGANRLRQRDQRHGHPGPDFDTLDEDTVVPLRSFNDNRFIFEEAETIGDGLGPTYNAQSCRECHQNVVTGGASQVAEHRTGRLLAGQFFESLGGSLVHSRAIHPDIIEVVTVQDDIRTFRISTNTVGDGFVEALSNSTLLGHPRRAAGRHERDRRAWCRCSKPTTRCGSADSAGRTSTPAWSRSPPMPT